METGASAVTCIISTHIAVMGTEGARWIKAAINVLLAGLTFGLRTGITATHALVTNFITTFSTITKEPIVRTSIIHGLTDLISAGFSTITKESVIAIFIDCA
jgi:hypothetical protein